jgi:hypothetical protein
MIGDLALVVHVAAGAAALAIGPLAIRNAALGVAEHRAGDVLHGLVAVVCLSASVLAVFDWSRLWFFVPIAAGSYAFALRGHHASRRRRHDWRAVSVRAYGGAYIALTTALIVVSFAGTPLLWLLPTVVGVPAFHLLAHRTATNASAPGSVEGPGASRRTRLHW